MAPKSLRWYHHRVALVTTSGARAAAHQAIFDERVQLGMCRRAAEAFERVCSVTQDCQL